MSSSPEVVVEVSDDPINDAQSPSVSSMPKAEPSNSSISETRSKSDVSTEMVPSSRDVPTDSKNPDGSGSVLNDDDNRSTTSSIDDNGNRRSSKFQSPGTRGPVAKLNYDVIDNSAKKSKGGAPLKRLLYDFEGRILPGRFLAIMGNSGSGKSTLLNILSGQRMVGKVSGIVYVNGEEMIPSVFSKTSAYVTQDDIMMTTVTPYEAIEFSAKLRLPVGTTVQHRNERINDIIDTLGLRKSANTIIGAPGVSRGISGGERKRVNIGVELVTDPGVLFVDEPTSGLDSFTACEVMKILVTLAHNGRTVLSTIHQPSSDIFHMFDDLMLLHNDGSGGRIVYFGPSCDAVAYFASIGFPCPNNYNPADWLMLVLNKKKEEMNGVNLHEKYLKSEGNKCLEIPTKRCGDCSATVAVKTAGRRAQLQANFIRSFRNYVRDPTLLKSRLLQTTFMGLLVGLIFLNLPSSGPTATQNRNGVLFFMVTQISIQTVIGVILTLPADRPMFLREYNTGTYMVSTYFGGRTFADTPFILFFPLLFLIPIYFMAGLRPGAGYFFTAYATLGMIALVSQSLAMFAGAIAPNPNVAVGFVGIITIPFMLASGFLANASSFNPFYLIWLYYLSYYRYGFEILAINEYADRCIGACDAAGLACTAGVDSCVIGNTVLASLNISSEFLIRDFFILVGMFLFFRFVAMFALYRQTKSGGA